MAKARDPFQLALASIRERVRRGCYAPGQPVVIVDEAGSLGLSTTPVREALAWLCGEGLIERGPAGGFLAPRLEVAVIRDRYGFRLLCLLASLDMTISLVPDTTGDDETDDPIDALQILFERLVRRSGNPVLTSAFDRVGRQMAVIARAERRVFTDLEAEARAILGDSGASLRDRIGVWHRVRMDSAALLMLEARSGCHAVGADRGP